MCFSPEASFTASAVVSVIGIISFKKSKDRPGKILSLIPIFFGLQQFSEGLVWLASLYEPFEFLKPSATIGFLLFAWVVWPSFIPYSMTQIETGHKQIQILRVFKFIGFGLSGILVYVLLFRNIQPEVVDCSIVYDFEVRKPRLVAFGILYLILTVVPTMLSSVKWMWLLGVTNLLAYFITKIYISDRILSIWCFFAALSSILILWIVMERNKKIH